MTGALPPLCVISRIGTRSAPTYSLRELGNGWIAASSTCAVAARNFGLAFMAFSYGGITRIRFEGFVSPESTRTQDPQRKSGHYNPRAHGSRASTHQHGGAANPHLGGARSGCARPPLRGAARGVRPAAAPLARFLRSADSVGRRRAHVGAQA